MKVIVWTSTLCLLVALVAFQAVLEIRGNLQHKKIEQRLDRLEKYATPSETNLFSLTDEISGRLEKDGKEIELFYNRDGRVYWRIVPKPPKKGWFQ